MTIKITVAPAWLALRFLAAKLSIAASMLLRRVASILVEVFRPDFYPLVGYAILFTFTYLSILPWQFKLWVLSAVCLFTILVPQTLILVVRKSSGWRRKDMHLRHPRLLVCTIKIFSYLLCIYACQDLYVPAFMGAILVVSLMVQCVCVSIGYWHRVSMPCAGGGLIIGSLLSYSHLFVFNPIWWLCASIVLSGALMSSCMLVKHAAVTEVSSGTIIGIVCGLLGILVW